MTSRLQYLPLKFDVMMGGGQDYFDPAKRKDKDNVYKKFDEAGYVTVKTKKELLNLSVVGNQTFARRFR